MIAEPACAVVDLQKDFAEPGYALGAAHMQSALNATGTFLERYRRSGRTPILVRTIHDDTVDSPSWIRKYDRPEPGNGRVSAPPRARRSSRRSPMNPTTSWSRNTGTTRSSNTYLRANGVSELLVCGTATNVCVGSTVRSAYNRDYEVRVLVDCCTTADRASEDHCLENMDRHFGDPCTSAEVALPAVAIERLSLTGR